MLIAWVRCADLFAVTHRDSAAALLTLLPTFSSVTNAVMRIRGEAVKLFLLSQIRTAFAVRDQDSMQR